MTCQESVSLGAYMLGALDGRERAALERHLDGCPRCRDELVQLAPLPGLLRRTPFEEMAETAEDAEAFHRLAAVPRTAGPPAEPAPPSPGGGGTFLPSARGGPPSHRAAPHHEPAPVSHRRDHRARRLLTAASVAVAACATGAAVYLGVTRGDTAAAQPAAATLHATDPASRVGATAGLVRKAWGTQVELRLDGLPQGIRCSMVVHTRDGRTETGGTWGSGYADTTSVPASTSARPEDISSIDIVSDSGHRLVRLTQGQGARRDG
ncbi:zf-HC2 domain-containing protein [Streptacidiphilus sp. ASG 303]|uniref:anti-sigma factor family protein n=1 Tax=Streptacidiphilus sp. ASG 303 TaxID=2896847 RepID=UPI001E5E3566|nr:zf-HC2 domain-containing protein [Streptacidiphilus sp. ASG 303]MCD0483014.1 zf-HC2 domain-containing protein [Streptacidiphilus sp. ASG 303]